VDLSKIFLLKKFKDYYSKSDLYIPPNFEKREWAIVPFENEIMCRHLSFTSDVELKAYILSNIPAHIYYSSAYYQNPSAEMDKKGWIGADLIFDIDADHLPTKSLEYAKKEVLKLIKILEDDFGIDKKNIEVVFSGHRGYHVHVYDERFKELESAERREIVDYLMLNRLKCRESKQMKRVGKCIAKYLMNAIRDGRIYKILKEKIKDDSKLERTVSILKSSIKDIMNGDFSAIPSQIFDKIFNLCKSRIAVHVDPVVTADIKRLIRLPNSLHGKTGLRVTVVPIDELKEFDPLTDAVVFSDEMVKIRVKRKVKLRMKGEEFVIEPGKNVVPEYLAIFLICRGVAVYGH